MKGTRGTVESVERSCPKDDADMNLWRAIAMEATFQWLTWLGIGNGDKRTFVSLFGAGVMPGPTVITIDDIKNVW